MENFEKILSNPGLQHLAEDVFWNLDYEDLQVCRGINQSAKRILDNQNQFPRSEPLFLLKKFVRRGGISKEIQNDWTKYIQSTSQRISDFTLRFLKQKWKNGDDIPCYTSPIDQDHSQKKRYRCLQCSFFTDDSKAIISHHLQLGLSLCR